MNAIQLVFFSFILISVGGICVSAVLLSVIQQIVSIRLNLASVEQAVDGINRDVANVERIEKEMEHRMDVLRNDLNRLNRIAVKEL